MTEQDMISRTEARLMTHEQVCAERYSKIDESLGKGDKRMTKIEYLLYAVMAIVLLGPGVGAEFVKKLISL
jgi:predicted nucleic acid-binding Zn ribbon protein